VPVGMIQPRPGASSCEPESHLRVDVAGIPRFVMRAYTRSSTRSGNTFPKLPSNESGLVSMRESP
jgi:hypothetical protein